MIWNKLNIFLTEAGGIGGALRGATGGAASGMGEGFASGAVISCAK